MTLIDLAEEKTAAEVRQLVDDIEAGRVPVDQTGRLKTLINRADDERQSEAIDVNPAIADLMVALDIRPPRGFGVTIEDQPVDASEDAEVEVEPTVPEQGEEPAGLEGVPQPGGPEPAGRGGVAAGARLSNLPVRFPQPNVRNEYQRLENARQNINDDPTQDMDPGPFWDQFAERVLGTPRIITREEFVEGRESPGTTGLFK